MTSLADARAELVTALDDVGIGAGKAGGAIEPPCALIFGEGLDLTDRAHVARGQVPARFRVVLVGGIFDDGDVPGGEVAVLAQSAITAVRALTAWALTGYAPERALRVAGGVYLGAELSCSRMIDI